MEDQDNTNIYRAEGVTNSERYLKTLADNSFLTLWCYSSVFRNQGQHEGKGDGKELCDLLVVFQNHVLIFSDKDCVFPDTGNLDTDWGRWYKKAIEKSADQVYGAERWIKNFPNKIFLDRSCTRPFPIPFPDPSKIIIHRIIVAHGAAERCKTALGGSGSLMIFPDIIGEDHKKSIENGLPPFSIGQLNPGKGFIHVFDDTSLDIVLKKLDTITDFVKYLDKKENFVLSNHFGGAAGEEELLGYYLKNLNSHDEHDFTVISGNTIFLDEGIWEDFLKSPQAKSQAEADEVSYAWDRLIKNYINNIEAGTLYYTSHPEEGLAHYNKILGYLAQESRFHRRMLSNALLSHLSKPMPPNQNVMVRTIRPTNPGTPYYVLLATRQPSFATDDQYRIFRANALEAYCKATKQRFPDAEDIVGYATEPGLRNERRSDDLIYFDAREWKPEDDSDWIEIQQNLDIATFEELHQFQIHEDEYPDANYMRVNVGDYFFDIQRPIRNNGAASTKGTLVKNPDKKSKKKKIITKPKIQKKKPGPRSARTRK